MLSALIVLLRVAEVVYARSWDLRALIGLAIVGGISIALALIAWSALYQRRYMAWAEFSYPFATRS
jgi:hypothetical protein